MLQGKNHDRSLRSLYPTEHKRKHHVVVSFNDQLKIKHFHRTPESDMKCSSPLMCLEVRWNKLNESVSDSEQHEGGCEHHLTYICPTNKQLPQKFCYQSYLNLYLQSMSVNSGGRLYRHLKTSHKGLVLAFRNSEHIRTEQITGISRCVSHI